MRRPRIVVTVADRRIRKILTQLLRAAHCNVKLPRPSEVQVEVERGEPCALMVLDSAFLERTDEQMIRQMVGHVRTTGGRVLMVNEGTLEEKVPQLFREMGLTNLIAKASQVSMLELLVTANKLMTEDYFGIEKYLPWGTRVVTRTLHDSAQREELAEELGDFVHLVGCGARLGEGFLLAADELVTNAIYNAPVDEHGAHLFRHVDRTKPIKLPVGSEVTIKYACDGQHLILGVADKYGSLERETLINYLERCFARRKDQIENKLGGAGIGLFMVFRALNTFVVNIVPGECTEMIGFIEIGGSYRDYIERDTSFHIFTKGS